MPVEHEVKGLHRNLISWVVLLLLHWNLMLCSVGCWTWHYLYDSRCTSVLWLYIQWLDCLSDCSLQPRANRLLWDGCHYWSQILCDRNPVFPVSCLMLAVNFKCTGAEGKEMVRLAAFFRAMTPRQMRMHFDKLGWYWLGLWRQKFTMWISVWHYIFSRI